MTPHNKVLPMVEVYDRKTGDVVKVNAETRNEFLAAHPHLTDAKPAAKAPATPAK